MDAKNKEKKHDVLKRLKYRSKLPGERYIDPGQEQVTFDHLSDADYLLLLRKHIIRPAAPAPAKTKQSKDGES